MIECHRTFVGATTNLTDVPYTRMVPGNSPICLDMDEDVKEEETFRSQVEDLLLQRMDGSDEEAAGFSEVFSRLAKEDAVLINALRGLERQGKTPENAVNTLKILNRHTQM